MASRNDSSWILQACKSMLVVLGILVICIVLYFGSRGFNMFREALDRTSLSEMASSIREAPGYTPLEELPECYLDAVVAVEDHRFYRHPGVDLIATTRALAHNVKAGDIVEGGSTITQQLAKNQFFTQEQDMERKVAEMFMAIAIEQRFGKDEILELYVNSIYFGEGYYGIGNAAEGYFAKDARAMSDCECTLMAGVPNAPSAYAPNENPELARQRQQQVVGAMLKHGALTDSEASELAVCAA